MKESKYRISITDFLLSCAAAGTPLTDPSEEETDVGLKGVISWSLFITGGLRRQRKRLKVEPEKSVISSQ